MILTKGDNNLMDDRSMYPDGQEYVSGDQIIGFVRGYVPFIGWIVIGLQRIAHLGDMAGYFMRKFNFSQ